MAQHTLIEENESLKLQICELKLQLSYNKHMFDYAWQLLLSYSQWYKIPQCLYELIRNDTQTYSSWAQPACRGCPVLDNLNTQRKSSLLTSYATAYLNHTLCGSLTKMPPYVGQNNQYNWHGYSRPNREFPMRELLPYYSSEIEDASDVILDIVD